MLPLAKQSTELFDSIIHMSGLYTRYAVWSLLVFQLLCFPLLVNSGSFSPLPLRFIV